MHLVLLMLPLIRFCFSLTLLLSRAQCVDCEGDPLCAACWAMHMKTRSSKHHTSAPLGETAHPKMMCPEHPTQEMLYFCLDDKVRSSHPSLLYTIPK